MRSDRLVLGVCLSIAWLAPGCFAQGKFEFQPFAGVRFGGTLRSGDSDPAPVKLKPSAAMGASFSYNPIPEVGLEFTWTSQQTKGETPGQVSTLRLNQYLFNFVFDIPLEKKRAGEFVPFLLAGLGASAVGGGDPSTKFSWAVGGGIKHFFSKHCGWRVQARYTPIYLYTTPLNNPTPCVTYPNYCSQNKVHNAEQGDITAGFIFRF